MKMKSVLGLVIIFSLCLTFSSPVWAADKKEILIGTHLSLTGMLAMSGTEQKWAYEAAVSDFNKNGGIFVKEYGKKLPIKLVVADDESDGSKAAAAVEMLSIGGSLVLPPSLPPLPSPRWCLSSAVRLTSARMVASVGVQTMMATKKRDRIFIEAWLAAASPPLAAAGIARAGTGAGRGAASRTHSGLSRGCSGPAAR